jgi:cation transporter-like permease
MSLLAASDPVVDWGKLGQVVAYSAVVGIGVALCFSLAILGATRFAELRRSGGGSGAAVGYALLATLGLAATVAAAVVAIVVMTKKS